MANQDPNRRLDNNNNNNNNNNGNRSRFSILWLLAIVLLITVMGNQMVNLIRSARQEETTYNVFLDAMENDEIAEVRIETDRIDFVLRKDESSQLKTIYYTGILPNVDLTPVVEQLRTNNVKFKGEIIEQSSMIFSWLLLPLLLFFGLSLLARFMLAKSGGEGVASAASARSARARQRSTWKKKPA